MKVKNVDTLVKKISYLLIYLFTWVAFAQHPIYTQFTEKDDLPDVEFYNMMEDSKGFIWLAADKGFYRYDGNEFKVFTNKDKRGLSVFEPKEDHLGRVWCCNISGQFFYVKGNELITFVDLGQEISWQLASFLITEKHLLVFTALVAYKISLETKEIEARIKLSDALLGNPERFEDVIFITDCKAILTLDLELNIINRLTSEEIYHDLSYRTLGKTIIESHQGRSYMRFIDRKNHSNLYLFDANSGRYEKQKLEQELAESYIVGLDFYGDKILVSSSNGVWVYILKEGEMVYENRYFTDQYITKVVIDVNENYWFTTLRNGVFVVPNINNNSYKFPNGIEDFKCTIKINDESFFFGTAKGEAGIYNIYTNEIEYIDLHNNTLIDCAFYDKNEQLLYISQQSQGVIYDLKTKQYRLEGKIQNVRSLSYLEKDTYFYTNFQGAVKVKNGERVHRMGNVRAYIGFHDTISKNSYVCYVDDLVKYDREFNKTKIRYQGKRIHSVDITKTADGIIWVSTFKDGLYGIRNDSVIVNYQKENGLNSNFIQKIKGDGNDIWIVTNKGIQLLNTKTKTFKTLTKGNGVSTYLVNDIVPFKDKVVFATNKNIFTLDRETVFQSRPRPEIYFTGIQINEKDTLLQRAYKLPYSQNAIKLSFNSNGFRSKEDIRYQSRLLGFNENWIPVDEGIDFVKYNSLPVGNYTFQVKAVSMSLAGESEVISVDFSIKSPFWKRPWFIISSVLSMLLLIVLYYRNTLKKRDKQKNKELEKLAQERELVFLKLENLRSQMNPHFIFNALNSIQEYIILNKKNLASDYLGKFADLIRTYLNHSNKGMISVQDEVDCLEMYLELEQLRFEDKLKYFMHIRNIDTETCMIPTMLIQPYVENALKHGLLHKKDNRLLTIELKGSETESTIICIIEDNGVGREKALELKAKKDKMYKSFGTQATQDRLNLLNYGKEKRVGVTIEDLHDKNTKQPNGTKVIITIPITKN
ncbi:histidine kinase [uncultured Kordia sp.]|uniref:sensor histidine kinase n=1 Tax=uncultured Kordia sp. TaxID=507699 RepID=UPI002631882F|nr:histidine kinase [uncultured Kordia sp.]